MTANTERKDETTTIIQLTPSFWSLVVLLATTLVTITVTIVTRPDEQKVQQMIDVSMQRLDEGINRVDETIGYTRDDLNRIERKLEQLIERGDR